MGPDARAKGYICLRDMIDPSATHCLSPQPDSYDHFDPRADVHHNSGIPNRAFAVFARAVGGNAWEAPLKIWYGAATGGRLSPTATFADFAHQTIAAAGRWKGSNRENLLAAVQEAWATVKVSVPQLVA
jgi:Zn-dependent metalloprotease